MIPRWFLSWLLFRGLCKSGSSYATATSGTAGAATTLVHPPNIVVLVVESTDGRTWQRGYQKDVIPLPNLRKLEDQGATSFYRHYCNIPVCCPSRASFWSGKYPHRIPHMQASRTHPKDEEEYLVNGVWNNFEGLPEHYSESIFNILQDNGYSIHLSGKQDYQTGGHTLSVRMNAWTMYVDFPYNLTRQEPWVEEDSTCRDNGTVTPTNPETPQESSTHKDDWKTLNETLDWIREYHQKQQQRQNSTMNQHPVKPFFVYQGMNIVHPPYTTNQYWLDQIDESKIHVPYWPSPLKPSSLLKMHPCNVHMSMLKGCLPTSPDEVEQVLSIQRRRHVRRIYYAMIAEFDAMVGRYMDTLEELGLSSNTIFIVTSDHGDMQMEHAQYYKMSPYDASSRVPLIILDPRRAKRKTGGVTTDGSTHAKGNIIVDQPTQHVDLFPTILDLAGISTSQFPRVALDGYSLVPFLKDGPIKKTPSIHNLSIPTASTTTTHRRLGEQQQHSKTMIRKDEGRPPFVVVQYHGDDSPMSWFAIIQPLVCMKKTPPRPAKDDGNTTNDNEDSDNRPCMYKLVIWGTGHQVDSQLFDLTHDVDENINLIHDPDYELIIGRLHSNLETVVDYPSVAKDVARYNRQSFQHWIHQNPTQWKDMLNATALRWHESWVAKSDLAMAAIQEWLDMNETIVKGCRRELAWPPNNQ